jgi:hypothetical protein
MLYGTKSILVSLIGVLLNTKIKSERILIALREASFYLPARTKLNKGIAFAINSDLVLNFLNIKKQYGEKSLQD